jgi:hypothetical protein
MGLNQKQYTLRNIPESVDRVLRRRAKESGKSFNLVAVEALTEGAGDPTRSYDDLDFMIGSMSASEADAVEREVAAQRRVDKKLWR